MKATPEMNKGIEGDEIDRQIAEFQAHPLFDPGRIEPEISDEVRNKYMTRDGTFNHLAYEKDSGKLVTISEKGEKELSRSFKHWMVIFTVSVCVILSVFGVLVMI